MPTTVGEEVENGPAILDHLVEELAVEPERQVAVARQHERHDEPGDEERERAADDRPPPREVSLGRRGIRFADSGGNVSGHTDYPARARPG
jgi:hypothetical protein